MIIPLLLSLLPDAETSSDVTEIKLKKQLSNLNN